MSYDVELMGDYCAHCKRGESVYRWNYTSNLSGAWREAGADIGEFDGKRARDCAPILAAAIADMEARPGHFERFNPSNGWGSIETLIPALTDLMRAMEKHPDAVVEVSR